MNIAKLETAEHKILICEPGLSKIFVIFLKTGKF